MAWSGQFVFGSTFAAYFGPSDDNDLHQHAAFQIALARSGHVTVTDGEGREWRGNAFVIRPLVMHAIGGEGPLALIFFDPQSPLALQLGDHIGPDDIVPLPEAALPVTHDAPPDLILEALEACSALPPTHIDTRLAEAIARLGADPGHVSIAETARQCGMSESRLRVLARTQLGVPLSTWLLWRKLEKAARELASGASLADAALAGDFSDQAHFTRAMRRMFGITPRVAGHMLKPSSALSDATR